MNEIKKMYLSFGVSAFLFWMVVVTSSFCVGQSVAVPPVKGQSVPVDARKLANVEPTQTSVATKKPKASKLTLLESVLKQIDANRISKKTTYKSPDRAELLRFEERLAKTIKAGENWKRFEPEWNEEGWIIHSAPGCKYIVMAEDPHQQRGRGIYALRLDTKSNLFLQAPHRFYDQRTGTIVAKIFDEHDVMAAAWNSFHRKQFDIAHSQLNFLNAFTKVLLHCERNTTTVQVHGFSNNTKQGNAKSTSVIVSDSTRYPGRLPRLVAAGLKQSFGKEHSRLYPMEVRTLGGTRNSQAILLRGLGVPRFLHLEINAEFRKQLTKDASKRSLFFEAIKAGDGGISKLK